MQLKGVSIMAKTTEERIESVQEQIRQLENQRKRLIQEQKERERKARTKRLIERGAILESLIPEADAFTNEQIKAFLEKTIRTESARKAWANLSTAQGEPAAAKAAGAVQGGGVSTQRAGTGATGEAG
jgi:TolA-binding protein